MRLHSGELSLLATFVLASPERRQEIMAQASRHPTTSAALLLAYRAVLAVV